MNVEFQYRIALLNALEESIQALIKLEIEQEIADARSRGEAWVGSWTVASVQAELSQGSTLVALGQHDHRLKAFLCFRPPGPLWEIMLIVTLGPVRGHRLAGTLIDSLFSHIESIQFASSAPHVVDSATIEAPAIEVGLEVSADNLSALRCYERCGFIEQRRRKGYYSGSVSGPIDAVLMSAKRQRYTGHLVKQ